MAALRADGVMSTPNRQLFALMTTSEIVAMMTLDPAWKLPRDTPDYTRRMRAAVDAMEGVRSAVRSEQPPPPPAPITADATPCEKLWWDLDTLRHEAVCKGMADEEARHWAIREIESRRFTPPPCPNCGHRHTKADLHRTSCYPRKCTKNVSKSGNVPTPAIYVRSHERTPTRRVA